MTVFNKEITTEANKIDLTTYYYMVNTMAYNIHKKLYERNSGTRITATGEVKDKVTGIIHYAETTLERLAYYESKKSTAEYNVNEEMKLTQGEISSDTRIARNQDGTPMYGESLDVLLDKFEEASDAYARTELLSARLKTDIASFQHMYSCFCKELDRVAKLINKEAKSIGRDEPFKLGNYPEFKNKILAWKENTKPSVDRGSIEDRLAKFKKVTA